MLKLYSLQLVLLALCFSGNTAHAQGEFRPGYVVRIAGDTVRGAVDYRGAQRSARICRFRPSAGAPIERFTPSELRAYGFWQSKAYDSRLLPPADSAERALPGRPAFVEVLAAGPVFLYYRLDEAGQNHFYIATSPGVPVTELVYTRELSAGDGGSFFRENNRYRGTLSEAFAGCPAVQQQVAGLVFTMSALTGAVQRYNACVQPGLSVAAGPALAVRQSRLKLGLLVGVESSRLVFGDPDSQLDGSIVSRPALVGGLSLHYALPVVNERLALRLEALVERQKYAGEINTATYYFGYSRADVQAEAAYLRFPVLLRYSFPAGRLRPFLQAGVTSAYAVSHAQQLRFIYTNPNGTKGYTPGRPISSVRSFETAPAVGMGLQLPNPAGRAFQVEARAERGGGLFVTGTFGNAVWRIFCCWATTSVSSCSLTQWSSFICHA